MEDKWIETLLKGEILNEHELKILCDKVRDLLCEESNVQPVSAPVIVCGDIHGQFFDLMNLFSVGGALPEQKYIFLGDYVDRGYNGVEVLEYLLCLKLKYQGRITLLRGNHESRQISFTYGFYEEVGRKYGNKNPWKYFNDLFDYLPIAALIEGKIFCVHGGLSPLLSTVDQIRLINRKQEIPKEGAFCDLVWSDPENIDSGDWIKSARGAGYTFGWRVVKEFNLLNGLDLVCRAHQLAEEGFHYWFPEKNLVTVWSAPNYCFRCNNKATVLKINDKLEKTFEFFEPHEKSKEIKMSEIIPYFL